MERDEGVWTPTQVIARQLRAIRERRRLTAAQVAELMTEAGVKWDRSTVAKLENGHRESLAIEEVLALAAVLGVSPVHLFVPTEAPTAVAVTPHLAVDPRAARMWVRGQQPLPGGDAKALYSEVSREEWVGMQQAGIRVLLHLAQDLVDAWEADDKAKGTRVVDTINVELERQHRDTAQLGDAGTATDTLKVERSPQEGT